MKKPKRPFLRYHGGKFGTGGRVADFIISHFPPHRIYVEPFGGAASVLLRKKRSYGEIYNDRWESVVRIFRTLRDPLLAGEVERRLRLTPFARDEMKLTALTALAGLDDVEFTRRLIFRSFAGFGSAATNPRYNTGFRSTSKRTGSTPSADWVTYPDQVKVFTARLQGVTIENLDASEVMQRHDDTTLHYVDPPYVQSTRSLKNKNCNKKYEFEMTDEEHTALAETLKALKGFVILSGYASPLYKELYADWNTVEFATYADGARPRTEILFFNERAWAARPADAPAQSSFFNNE